MALDLLEELAQLTAKKPETAPVVPAAPAVETTPAAPTGPKDLLEELAAKPPGVPAPAGPQILPSGAQEAITGYAKGIVPHIIPSAQRAGEALLRTGQQIAKPPEAGPPEIAPIQMMKNIAGMAKPAARAFVGSMLPTIEQVEERLGIGVTPEQKKKRAEDVAIWKSIQEPVGKFIEKAATEPAEAGKDILKYIQEHPVEVAIDLFPWGKAAKAARPVSTTAEANNIRFAVRKGWTEGIQAKMEMPKKVGDVERYLDRASRVTTDMASVKDRLPIRSARTGEEVIGRTPKTMEEFAGLFDARKNEIGQIIGEANAMAAGKVQMDVTSIANKLDDMANTFTSERSGVSKYLRDLAETYRTRGKLDISEIQEEITSFNKLVKNTDNTADLANKQPAHLMLLQDLRKMHEKGIMAVQGEGMKHYKQLYSDYLATEKDVTNKLRSEMIKTGLKQPFIDDLFTKYTLGELTFGLATGHGLATAKAFAFAAANRVVNKMQSVDRKLSKMMGRIDEILSGKKKSVAEKVARPAATAVAMEAGKTPQTDEEIEEYLRNWVKTR